MQTERGNMKVPAASFDVSKNIVHGHMGAFKAYRTVFAFKKIDKLLPIG